MKAIEDLILGLALSVACIFSLTLAKLAEADEEMFYEEDPNFEYNPTTPSEPADPNDIPF
jgi:hypothetical protein